MAKLLKLRRGTTSQHSSFTGAEGELTIDTTKDTAVVHDGSTAGGRPLLREDLDNMPASGVGAGTYGSSSAIPAITVNAEGLVTAATTSAIDSTTIANGTSNVAVANNGEVTVVRAGSQKLTTKSNGIDVTGEVQCDTADISGNLAVGGTVDGRDVASDGTKLDGIEALADVTDATNVNAAGAVMNSDTSTGSMSFVVDEDNMSSNSATKVPTQQSVKTYVDTEVAGVIDSAPGALDTLNELAAALGDDANFSTTVTNSIATKLSKSGGQMTGNITFSGSQTVDGRDLSSDGAKLDGIASGATNVTNNNQLTNGAGYITSAFVTGMILMYSGSSAPTGFAICDGSNGTPDLRDRFVIGAGSTYSAGSTGGSADATLPSHSHTYSYATGNNANRNMYGISSAAVNTTNSVSHSTQNTSTEGASATGANLPPYYALMFIMKT